jgi:hypothetical protein
MMVRNARRLTPTSIRRPLLQAPAHEGAGAAMALAFDGVPFPVVFRDCADLMAGLEQVLRGWPVRRVPEVPDGPRIEVAPDRAGYRTDATWLDEALERASAASTICSLMVDLVQALVTHDASLLCLHCAAARLDDRLVVFTGPNRMGKSTLMARLAIDGIPIFADDLLLIAGPHDHGRSLGMRGRLRLPLPKGASASFRNFVAAHAGPRDERYLYVDAPAFERFGATAPVGAVVLLERRRGITAHFVSAGRAEALRHLVQRNLARGEHAQTIMDRLHRVMTQSECVRLVYSDLDDAAALIAKTFSPWLTGEVATAAPPQTGAPAKGPFIGRRVVAVARHAMYRSHPDVAIRGVEGELFLAGANGDAIWHLNELGAAVWRVLAESASAADMATILTTAFPNADPATIARDIDALFARLAAHGLIVEVEPGAA